jgi:hypothetical protein
MFKARNGPKNPLRFLIGYEMQVFTNNCLFAVSRLATPRCQDHFLYSTGPPW